MCVPPCQHARYGILSGDEAADYYQYTVNAIQDIVRNDMNNAGQVKEQLWFTSPPLEATSKHAKRVVLTRGTQAVRQTCGKAFSSVMPRAMVRWLPKTLFFSGPRWRGGRWRRLRSEQRGGQRRVHGP